MAFLGQEEQIREFQERFKYLYAILFIGLGILLSRMVYLQVLKGDEMRQYSEENRIKKVKIASPRGMIFDRNRTLLIDNRPAFDLEIIPQYFKLSSAEEKVETFHHLSRILKMPESDLQAILDKAKGQPSFLPVKVKTDLARDEVAEIESWKISMPGIQVEQEIKRTNIFGDVASHLLGYIGEVNPSELQQLNKAGSRYKLGDSVGKYGLEQRMEEVLRGQDGEKLVEVDAFGRIKLERGKSRVLQNSAEKQAVPGKNLILSIDQDLQMAATQAFGDKVGGLVAIDPRSGEILAMISRPSFDPTSFSRGIPPQLWSQLLNNEHRPLRDKTIQDHYSPGSVFKIVTAIAGLEEGVIDTKSRIGCSGKIAVGNRLYHCHKKGGHGDVNVVSAITESCDIFFYRVAQKLGVDKIAKWATYLGLGRRTGINLAREVPGLIPTEAWKQKRFGQEWNGGETLSVAIGQSYVLTTAIQLANLYASIANGGTVYRPYLVREIESYDGQVLKGFKPEAVEQHRLKPDTLESIKLGLWGVVNSPRGTAILSRLPGMDFVGKTGTVQVIRLSADKIYGKCESMKWRERHNAMFTGYAPANDPKIAIAVIGEHACHGSSGAAPIARAVIRTYLQKYYPELYSEKAIAARLKAGGAPVAIPAQPVNDDLTPDDGNDTTLPPVPSTQNRED